MLALKKGVVIQGQVSCERLTVRLRRDVLGANYMVFADIELLQKRSRRIENPIEQQPDEENTCKTSSENESVFWITKRVADCTHRKWPQNCGHAGEEQNQAGDCTMLRLAETAYAFGIDCGIKNGHEQAGQR